MNTWTNYFLCHRLQPILLLLMLAAPPTSHAQLFRPERFGVVDTTPNSQSGWADDNTEPSLCINTNGSRIAIHTFGRQQSEILVSSDSGTTWGVGRTLQDFDGTLDWNTGSKAYMSVLTYPPTKVMQIWSSPDPTSTSFSPISSATINGSFDQPGYKLSISTAMITFTLEITILANPIT